MTTRMAGGGTREHIEEERAEEGTAESSAVETDFSALGDARPQIPDIQALAGEGTVVYKSLVRPGETVANPAVVRQGGRFRHVRAAPPLTAVEQAQASQALEELMPVLEMDYPQLTASLLANPNSLFLLPEIQLMLSDQGTLPSHDMTADIVGGILANPASDGAIGLYEETRQNETQSVFWAEVASVFDEPQREAFITLLSQLSEDGADNTASLALAWAEENDLGNQENRDALLLNMWQWAYGRQQHELGEEGFFGFVDAPQQFVEDKIARPVVDWLVRSLGSPEEAVRRKGLTLGQQVMYQLGVRPSDAGEAGMWNTGTGVIDAITEIGLDPLNLIAGVGAGAKAVRTIPIAAKATRAGRLAAAGRAMLPRVLTGSQVRGGRAARVTYAFRAKTYDDLLDGLVKPGRLGRPAIADDIAKLVKSNNAARLAEKYPQIAKMSDEMWDAISITETPEEVVEVLRHGNLRDVLTNGMKRGEMEVEAAQAWQRVSDALGESVEGRKLEDILSQPNLPRELTLDAINKQVRFDTARMRPHEAFIISDIPQHTKRIFSRNEVIRKLSGDGRFKTGLRQTVARATPGSAPDQIHIFSDRRGMNDIRSLMSHYGVEASKIDDVVNEFITVELGGRQEWFFKTVLPTIGEATGVPVLQHDLVTLFRSGGTRAFSSSGQDLWTDAAGTVRRGPILSSQMNDAIPLPIREIDEIVRRARDIGNRGKAARAMRMTGRGVLGKTKSDRAQLVARFRKDLVEKGEDVDNIPEEALWQMAYSYVDGSASDGRGFMSGFAMPALGSGWDRLHRFFTKSMLLLRPGQWAWRVVGLEEPLRAAIFNLPSLYRNPYAYIADAKDAYYLSKLKGWRETNLGWAEDAYQAVTSGFRTVDDGIEKLKGLGLGDIFDEVPTSVAELRTGVAAFLDDAVRNRTRINRLDPIKSVSWAVRRRASKIDKYEKKLAELGKPSDFDIVDDLPEIQQKLANVYLAGAVGSSNNMDSARWVTQGMTSQGASNYGHTYARKLIELVEDPFGKMALRRYVASLAGKGTPPSTAAKKIVGHSRWPLMAPDMRRRFPDAADDLEVANQYMDVLLRKEVETLFAPFLANKVPDEQVKILDDFLRTRKVETDLDGTQYLIDLSAGNVGAGARRMGEIMDELKRTKLPMPADLPAVAMDPRFMENDIGMLKLVTDKAMQFFGETATQVMNRRPAWVAEQRRWLKHFKGIGIPEKIASELATKKAIRMVNHVFYNLDEAPYLVERLNRYVPFFGATYEVLSAWTYKMPAEVGGNWLLGAGEFARKFRRLMDAFVNTGLVERELEADGTVRHKFVPRGSEEFSPDNPDGLNPNEIGKFLRGAGWKMVNTLESTIGTILGMEDGLGLRDAGYLFTVGDPLDPTDYGMLSFAQANLSMSPQGNYLFTKLASSLSSSADSARSAVAAEESLADVAERLDVDVLDLARLNRAVLFDDTSVGSLGYVALLAGRSLPTEIFLPEGTLLDVPDTDVFSNVIADIYAPFGQIEDGKDLLTSWVPGVWKHALAGMAIQTQPTDAFYSGDYTGVWHGILPDANQAAMASQLSEAFMYVEAHKRLGSGESRFDQILRLQGKADAMKPGEAKDELEADIEDLSEDFLTLVQKTAQESLYLRSLSGMFMPTTPGHVRAEQEAINRFWQSREYADSLRIGDGKMNLRPFGSMEEVDQYFDQVAAWLSDPTGDAAKAEFREAYPQAMAYLTPKTYWKDGGIPPEVASFDAYMDQIKSGDRVMAPLHVTMFKAKSAAIQADYYTKYVSRYGSDPLQAAANAMWDLENYVALQEERDLAYQALNMQDDMHGGIYSEWREEMHGGDSFEKAVDELQTIRDNVELLLELDTDLDVEIDLDGIKGLTSSMRAAISQINGAIDQYKALGEQEDFAKNPYEEAIFQYFEQVYSPFKEAETAMYEELGNMPDSEQVSLQYERIKLYKEQAANTTYFLNGDTTTPFPSPLEWRWQRYDDQTRTNKVQLWITRPVEWLDQDQAQRIVEHNPAMAAYVPTADQHFDVYRNWTLKKIEVEELLEDNAISSGDAMRLKAKLKQEARDQLVLEGRSGEVAFMDMTPFERLEVGGALPAQLTQFGDYVRYYKDALAAQEVSAGTEAGRQIVQPLYEMARQIAYSDPAVMDAFRTIGETTLDKTNLDQIFPHLFFGNRQEF